ncbi:MAG: ABC transporter ATP-binding protein [Candidatus Methanofastidiosia archaeon]
MDAVTIENLTKTYNGTHVLKGITLTIPQGEFYCLMGPNGSGKTTLVSIIASVRSPTQGTIKIFGESPDQAKPLIGYVPQENFSSPSLTGKENLVYFARILGYPKSKAELLADDLLQKIGLSTEAQKRVSHYSGGMRKRLEVATALFPGINLLILDEPTTGLDPSARRTFFGLIDEIKEKETTILLVTHIGADAELATRVGLMDKGILIAEGDPETLKDQSGLENVVTVDTAIKSNKIIDALKKFGTPLETDTGYRIPCKNAEELIPDMVRSLDNAGVKILRLEMTKPSLEDVFFNLTGKSVGD